MRAMRARRNWSLTCRRALMTIAGVALAGAAWADADQPSGIGASQLASVQDGSSPPPPAASAGPRPTVTDVSAETSRGGNGGDDRRLFMLMMLGQVASGGGPFGRLGQ